MNKGHRIATEIGLEAGGPSSLAGSSRRERRALETRVRLFRCALQLFAERGFPSVTVEDITEAADVGKGTFFNYFETKDHVLGVMAEIQLGKVGKPLALAGTRQADDLLSAAPAGACALAEEPGRSPELARALISSFLASEGVRAIDRAQYAGGPQDDRRDCGRWARSAERSIHA